MMSQRKTNMLKKLMESRWAEYALLFVLMLPLCINLFESRLINAHDAQAGMIMALYMDRYIGDGQWIIRWASEINNGYGYAMFNFYMPFFYFVTVLFSKITHNVVLSINLACLVFWLISGFAMYLFGKELWGRRGGLLAAVAYVYAPYHLQDYYIRGAFAELSSFAFFPLILYSFLKISQRVQRRYVFLGSLSLGLLCLTHTLMNMLFAPIIVCYLIFLFVLKKNLKGLMVSLAMLWVSVLVSAFYWLPAFWEKQYLNLNFLVSLRNDYHNNFIHLAQLCRTPWFRDDDFNGISFRVGMLQIVLILITVVWIWKLFKQNRDAVLHFFFFLGVTGVTIFFTFSCSEFFWDHIGLLKFVQLPWRFLVILAFTVSLLVGAFMMLIKNKVLSNYVLACMIFLVFIFSMRFLYTGKYIIVDQEYLSKNVSKNLFMGEGVNTPKWIKEPLLSAPAEKFQFIAGSGQFTEYQVRSSIEHTIKVRADQPSVVCFHSFYFPGWKVFIDQTQTEINPENRYGVILFNVPAGEHTIRVVFGTTPVRTLAMICSWLGVFLLIFILLYRKFYEKKSVSKDKGHR